MDYRTKFKRNVVVRINSLDSSLVHDDLDELMKGAMHAASLNQYVWPGPDMICLPKVENIDQLKWVID